MSESRTYGFTIVEILIVIVVIAILASITVVAYNGVQARSDYSKMKNDMASIRKALELYKVDNGEYPPSDASVCVDNGKTPLRADWCGFGQSINNSFIPGLAPKYIVKTPQVTENSDSTNTFLYRSSRFLNGSQGGTGPLIYYELIRYKPTGLTSAEMNGNSDLMTTQGYNGIGWGFKSDPIITTWW